MTEQERLLSKTICDGRIVESMTVEAIAKWLDTKAEQFGATLKSRRQDEEHEFGWGESFASGWAHDIRAGAWKHDPLT